MWDVKWPHPEKIIFPVSKPNLTALESNSVQEAMSSGWISSNGPFNRSAEEKLSRIIGQDTLLVSNGSVALTLALAGLGVGPGDEVIVPSLTFAATASAVCHVGATPIFCDVDLDTWQISVDSIEKVITDRTRAVIGVHLYGRPFDVQSLQALCLKYSIKLLEDCAESTLGTYLDKPLGSLSDAGTFSFFGNKLLSAGEGGAVTAKDPDVFRKMRILRGQGMDEEKRYFFQFPGYNFRMPNLSAAILDAQLTRRNDIFSQKMSVELNYEKVLGSSEMFKSPSLVPNGQLSPWIYTTRIKGISLQEKIQVAQIMSNSGIETRPVFYPLPQMNAFASCKRDYLPNSELISREGISLPSGSDLTSSEIEYICDVFKNSVSKVLLN
jgi:perosamine synthetase